MRRTSFRVLLLLALCLVLSTIRQSRAVVAAPAIIFGEVVSLSRQAFAPRETLGAGFLSVRKCVSLPRFGG